MLETKSAPTCVLSRATLPEMSEQSEMAATSAGIGDSQVKLSYESRLATASVSWDSLRPSVTCLIGFRKL